MSFGAVQLRVYAEARGHRSSGHRPRGAHHRIAGIATKEELTTNALPELFRWIGAKAFRDAFRTGATVSQCARSSSADRDRKHYAHLWSMRATSRTCMTYASELQITMRDARRRRSCLTLAAPVRDVPALRGGQHWPAPAREAAPLAAKRSPCPRSGASVFHECCTVIPWMLRK